MVTIKLELANSFTRRVCNDIIVDYNVFSLTYLYVYLDQQGAEMLEMQQISPQEQGYSQLFLSGQLTNNNINNNYPFYYWFSSLFD